MCKGQKMAQVAGVLLSTELEDRPRGGTVTYQCPVGLRELCLGGVLHKKFSRRRFQEDGMLQEETVVLDLVIKPGHKTGTKLVFRGEGDESHSFAPGDVVFVLKEKLHPTLSRVSPGACHLSFKPQLFPHSETYTLDLALPDGSTLPLTLIPGVTNSIYIENRGMPVVKKGEIIGYGDLVVTPQWKGV